MPVLDRELAHDDRRAPVKPYIHADPTLKQRGLERLTPLNPDARAGRYRPTDDLLAFLEGLS